MGILLDSNELRGYEAKRVILSPKQWSAARLPASLVWTVCQMSATPPSQIPDNKRGVYTFAVDPGIACHPRTSYLMYVGKAEGAEGFRSRYKKYRAERDKEHSDRPLINRMVRNWFDYLWFCFAELPSASIVATEDALLRAYLPPYNTIFPADVSPAMRAF